MTTAHDFLSKWDHQQTSYIEFRENRTLIMLEMISLTAGGDDAPMRVLDLACGPGSLTNAVLRRFPTAQVVAIDKDPVLLRILNDTVCDRDRVRVVDADLCDPDWFTHLGDEPFDAVLTATALHWLEPDDLWNVYRGVSEILKPGGIVMNADHLFYDAYMTPNLNRMAKEQRDKSQQRMIDEGASDWKQWWDEILAHPEWKQEAEEHRRRWSDKKFSTKVDAEFHLAAMRAAGLVETAQIWQWLDDRVVYSQKPANSRDEQ